MNRSRAIVIVVVAVLADTPLARAQGGRVTLVADRPDYAVGVEKEVVLRLWNQTAAPIRVEGEPWRIENDNTGALVAFGPHFPSLPSGAAQPTSATPSAVTVNPRDVLSWVWRMPDRPVPGTYRAYADLGGTVGRINSAAFRIVTGAASMKGSWRATAALSQTLTTSLLTSIVGTTATGVLAPAAVPQMWAALAFMVLQVAAQRFADDPPRQDFRRPVTIEASPLTLPPPRDGADVIAQDVLRQAGETAARLRALTMARERMLGAQQAQDTAAEQARRQDVGRFERELRGAAAELANRMTKLDLVLPAQSMDASDAPSRSAALNLRWPDGTRLEDYLKRLDIMLPERLAALSPGARIDPRAATRDLVAELRRSLRMPPTVSAGR